MIVKKEKSRAASYWFVTVPAGPRELLDFKTSRGAKCHAKTFGTRVTACGQIADSWTKAWEILFESIPFTRRCTECDLAVRRANTRYDH